MIKLSIAIADTQALPSAFVVYRGFEECIPKAAGLGFHGVELALKRADEIKIQRLEQLLSENHVEVSCISTGQVFADRGLTLTDENSAKRQDVIGVFKEFIDLAASFGRLVNMGRIRGFIGNRPRKHVEGLFCECVRVLSDYAAPKGVTLLLEPVNRYECDFINSVEEGTLLLREVGAENFKLMPDVFHMNIEDTSISGELVKHIDDIKYIHLADSNRLAPGQGHTDFREIFDQLALSGYQGWTSVEILPEPDPDAAARQSAEFLLPLINEYNETMLNAAELREYEKYNNR